MNIGNTIMHKRKAQGLTQQALAERLGVSFQAVSKWENGTNYPDIDMLPRIARALDTSVDILLGYLSPVARDYDSRYQSSGYFWGLTPNRLCYEILQLRPPVSPLRVLDVGCGEGKDAVFLARNGYIVSAFDLTETGLEKGRRLAESCRADVHFFRADLTQYRLSEDYDIILCSGMLHFIKKPIREEIIDHLKAHTRPGGLHAMNVFVEKPFVAIAPEKKSSRFPWKSGELFLYYHDWLLRKTEETIFDCESGGTPHQHCMDTMIAEKV